MKAKVTDLPKMRRRILIAITLVLLAVAGFVAYQFYRLQRTETLRSLLPDDLVDDEKELTFGDETVRVIHPGRGHTEPLVRHGQSLRSIEAAVDLHAFDDFSGMPFFTSRARNIESVYQELTGKKK